MDEGVEVPEVSVELDEVDSEVCGHAYKASVLSSVCTMSKLDFFQYTLNFRQLLVVG